MKASVKQHRGDLHPVYFHYDFSKILIKDLPIPKIVAIRPFFAESACEMFFTTLSFLKSVA
jgi:hypothetical protein